MRKKKLAILLLGFIAAASCAIGLSACDLFGGDSGTGHTHSLISVAAQEATCTEDGNIAYWYCSSCGRCFEDEDATTEIKLKETVVAQTGHNFVDGVCTVCEHVAAYDLLTFTIISDDGESYSVTTCDNSATEVIIPSTYDGKPVTAIASNAFYYCTSLTSITIPNSVTRIGEKAFYNCTSLTEINYNATECADLSSGNYVFAHAGSNGGGITVNIGANVTKIPAYLFDDAYKIVSVVFAGNSKCESIENSAFKNCTKLTSITIPDSMTSIGDSAFKNCTSLTGVYITDIASWYNISFGGSTANPLYYARNLYINNKLVTELTIDGVTKIGNYAFNGCTSLESITIPDGVTSIGYEAFCNCTSLTGVYITDIAFWYNISFGGSTANPLYYAGNLYINNKLVTELTIDGVTKIGNYAFNGCTSLESITIPDGVTTIGNSAFEDCTALTEINYNATECEDLSSGGTFYNSGKSGDGIAVNIGANVKKIPAYLFDDASKIVSVVFKENSVCESIGSHAFYGCSELTSIDIPDGVTGIENYAFYECASLTEINYNATECAADLYYNNYVFYNAGKSGEGITVNIGANVKKIPSFLFYPYHNNNSYSPKIVSVVFAEDSECESIGGSAFDGCTSLESITIPDSVTSIETRAFAYCTALKSVTIGSGVTTIGGSAFSGCTALTEINYNATECAADLYYNNYVFYNAGKSGEGITVNIGANVKKIPSFLFYPYKTSSSYSPKIVSVVFAKNSQCTNIGSYAFDHCTSLTSITIPDSVTNIEYAAFNDCTSLQSVTIGNGVASIANSAFYNCYKLIEVYNLSPLELTAGSEDNGYVAYYAKAVYTSTETQSKLTTQDDYIFYGDATSGYYLMGYTGAETELILPENFGGHNYGINQYAFYNCTTLTSITIPDGVTSIETYAFYNCTALTEINYNATECADLSNNNYVFSDAGKSGEGITVNIGANVKKIPAYLFCPYIDQYVGSSTYFPKIVSVIFEDNSVCESIGGSAFDGCTSLTSIDIPDRVTSIGSYAFAYCTALTSVTIGNGVTSIGWCAFRGCTSLTSIIIPDGVTSIEEAAFLDCYSLESITVDESNANYQSIDGNLYSKDGTTLIQYAIGKTDTSFTIPDGVTSMGWAAFYNCSSLNTVYYKGTTEEDWKEIDIDGSNTELTSATIYYYSESEPTTDGNYWHYDTDGVTPIVW